MRLYIKEWLEERDVSQTSLGAIMGKARVTTNRIINMPAMTKVHHLEEIAEILDCTVFDLMFRPPGKSDVLMEAIAKLPDDQILLLEKMAKRFLSAQK